MKTKINFLQISLFICLSICTFSCENNVEEEMLSIEEINNGNNDNEGNGGNNEPPNSATFSGTVQPIISNNCLPCHGNGGTSPNLTSFSSISNNASRVKNAVVSRRMPQGGSLSQADIDAIASWVDAGANNN